MEYSLTWARKGVVPLVLEPSDPIIPVFSFRSWLNYRSEVSLRGGDAIAMTKHYNSSGWGSSLTKRGGWCSNVWGFAFYVYMAKWEHKFSHIVLLVGLLANIYLTLWHQVLVFTGICSERTLLFNNGLCACFNPLLWQLGHCRPICTKIIYCKL